MDQNPDYLGGRLQFGFSDLAATLRLGMILSLYLKLNKRIEKG